MIASAMDEARIIEGGEALRRAGAWVTHRAIEIAEPSLPAGWAARVPIALISALVKSVAEGVVPLIGAGKKGISRALSSKSASPNFLAATLRRARLDRGAFNGWMLSIALEDLLRVSFEPLAAPIPMAHRRDVHPCAAVTFLALGEPWTPARWRAHIARVALVTGVLREHDEGVALLAGGALALVRNFRDQDARMHAALDAARERVERAIIGGELAAIAAATARALGPGDFATAIRLDPLQGKFIVAPDAQLFTTEWDLQRAACERIGQTRLSAAHLLPMMAKPKTTLPALRRAKADGRERCARWLDAGAPIPTRAAWTRQASSQFAISPHAANVLWTEVASESPAHAPMRRAGRRARIDRS